jgi:hypothetical protein
MSTEKKVEPYDRTPTPELDKMKENKEASQIIGDFLEWLLNEQHTVLARYDITDDSSPDEELVPIVTNIEAVLAEYFGVDLNKAEAEKRAILDALRAHNTR